MKTSIAALGALAAAALSISAPGAHACEREFGDSYYRLTPFQDDGLSRAERADCALGTLSAYTEQTGWVDMVDATGQQLVAQDIMGVHAAGADFLVVIGPDNQLVFRWGDFAGGQFFAGDNTFEALDPDGNPAYVQKISVVNYIDGQLNVEVYVDANYYCEISADAEFVFNWQTWNCYAPH